MTWTVAYAWQFTSFPDKQDCSNCGGSLRRRGNAVGLVFCTLDGPKEGHAEYISKNACQICTTEHVEAEQMTVMYPP